MTYLLLALLLCGCTTTKQGLYINHQLVNANGTVEELEGFLNNIFLKNKTRREKAVALHALLTTRKGLE